MHNESLSIELCDVKLDLTKLSRPGDNSTELLLIRFQRLSRIIFLMKCETLQADTPDMDTITEGK